MPLNELALRNFVAKQGAPVLIRQVRPIIKLDFETKKELFLKQFDENDISQEISEGPEAYSRIPALSQSGGNLFSLLGFYAEQKPIESLKEYLQDNIVLYKTNAGKMVGNNIMFETDIIAPTEEDINSVMASDSESKLEWTSRSFTDLLARGVSDLPQYIFDLTRDFSSVPSRSGPAIQTKGNLRSASVPPIPYVRNLLISLRRIISPNK